MRPARAPCQRWPHGLCSSAPGGFAPVRRKTHGNWLILDTRGEAPVIYVRNLTKYYGDYAAVQDVSFDVAAGQIVGFLGPNGAGKTTTMRILTGYMTATSGQAEVAGYDVFWQPLEARRRIGYLPENCPLYTEMRVGEYLHFRAGLKGLAGSKRTSR